MTFWNQLRRVCSWVVGVIALVTLALSTLQLPDLQAQLPGLSGDSAFGTPSVPALPAKRHSTTTGL